MIAGTVTPKQRRYDLAIISHKIVEDRGSNLNYSLNGRGTSFLMGEGVVSELTFGIDHNEPKAIFKKWRHIGRKNVFKLWGFRNEPRNR